MLGPISKSRALQMHISSHKISMLGGLIPRPSHSSIYCLHYYCGGRPGKTRHLQWCT